jgi:hypothetical protein
MTNMVVRLTLVVLLVASCRMKGVSNSRSIVGLEAGQEEIIKNSKSPIFVGLSSWFQGFKATVGKTSAAKDSSKNNPSKSVALESISDTMPPEYMKLIEAYLLKQLEIIGEFEAAVNVKNIGKIKTLLEQETLEMQDIGLAIMWPAENMGTLKTKDLLASVIYEAKKNHKGSYVDHFATKGFLEYMLKATVSPSFPAAIASVEEQRKIYLKSLVDEYTNDLPKFSKFLTKTRTSTEIFLRHIKSPSAGLSLAGASLLGGGSSGEMTGIVAVLITLLQGGATLPNNRIHPDPTPVPNPNPSNNPNNNPNNSTNPVIVMGKSAATSGVNLNDPPGRDLLADIPATDGTSKNQSTSLSLSALGSEATEKESVVSSVISKEQIFKSFVDPKQITAVSLSEPTAYRNFPAPDYDCNKDLKGDALVLCHRMAGYTIPLPRRSTSAQNPPKGEFSLDSSAPRATADIVRYKILKGSAEHSVGHIFSQGSIGSCSLQAAIGAGYIALLEAGVKDPRTLLPKDGNEINTQFAEIQRSAPTIPNAIETLKTDLEGKYTVVDRQLTDWNDAIQCIADGYPALIGVEIDMASWTSTGGGNEFGLSNLSTSSMVQCNPDGTAGHAIVGVGYDTDGNILIKNSWGATWNGENGGIAKMSKASCKESLYGFCIKVTKN